MTIPESFEIDNEAQQIFSAFLPKTWLVRKQVPDFYVDFFVEIEKAREPSGLKFGVQLKGTKTAVISDGFIKYRLEVKHLQYYINSSRQPIFIIVIDVNTRCGYWIFIQRYIKETLKKTDWQSQLTVTIDIPLKNKLEDIEKLLKAVEEAEIYMRELWPSSIRASAHAEHKKWASLDDRFNVDVQYIDEAVNIKFIARDEMNFQINFSNENPEILKDKLINLFDRGQRVEFSTKELQLSGSPLLQKINEQSFSKIELEASNRRKAELYLCTINDDGHELTRPYRIDGEFIFGRKEGRFECNNQSLPLNVNVTFNIQEILAATEEREKPFRCDFSFNDTVWEGKSIDQLQYFDILKAFFKSIYEGNNIKLLFENEGNHIATGYGPSLFPPSFINNIMGYLGLIEKIKFIVKHIGFKAIYPKQHTYAKNEVRDIHIMYDLLRLGEVQLDAAGFKLSMISKLNDKFIDELKQHESFDGPISFELPNEVFSLLGNKINLGPLRFTVTDGKLLTKIDSANFAAMAHVDEQIALDWEGKEGAKLIIALLKTGEENGSTLKE